jgi:WD40 repeat protein
VILEGLSMGHEIATLKGHEYEVGLVAFSRDGTRIVAYSRGTMKLWAVPTRSEVESRDSVVFSPDGTRIAVCYEGNLKLLDTVTGQEMSASVSSPKVTFSPDGTPIAWDSVDDALRLWDVSTGKLIVTLKGQTDVESLKVSPDGMRVASLSDYRMKLWNVSTGREILLRGSSPHADYASYFTFCEDGTRLISHAPDRHEVILWDASIGRQIAAIQADGALAFSPDGKRLATSFLGTVKIWNVVSGQEVAAMKMHPDGEDIGEIAFSKDGTRLASGDRFGLVKIWELATGQETTTLRAHTGWVGSIAFSPDG